MNRQKIKQTKQTVYLPVKVQNTSGNYIPDKSVLIVKEQNELDKYWEDLVEKQEGYFFTPSQLNDYISGIIKQSLEFAAERSEAIEGWNTGFSGSAASVGKQSIIKTFEEIYEGLKV